MLPPSATPTTTTYSYNDSTITYLGSWSDSAPYKVAGKWSAALQIMLTGDEISFTYNTGPDHSIFDVYIGKTLYQSYDGCEATTSEKTVTVELSHDGRILFEIRNRPEKNSQSTRYKVSFKQVQATSILSVDEIDYTYDALSRLIEADYVGGTNYTYGHDRAGNLTDMNGTTRTYNAANQMTNDGTNTLFLSSLDDMSFWQPDDFGLWPKNPHLSNYTLTEWPKTHLNSMLP